MIIPAASSSVGLAAIQAVKAEGATAIAATRTFRKRDELLSAGADYVIATKEEDLAEKVHQITDGNGARLIHPKIAKAFPLDHAVEAYQFLESNEQFGKNHSFRGRTAKLAHPAQPGRKIEGGYQSD